MSAKNGLSQRETWVKTKLELARLLGITRPTLDSYSVLADFPLKEARGWPLERCRAFAMAKIGRTEERRALELQKLKDEVARGQMELMRAAGELIPLEFAKRALAHWTVSTRNVIQNSDLTDAQKESLTAKIEGIDCTEFLSPPLDVEGATEIE